MEIVYKILTLIASCIGGVLIMKYNYTLTRWFGYQEFAERYLGSGGTYTMWKLIGLIVIIGGAIYTFM